MAIPFIGPLNQVINKTAQGILDSQLVEKSAGVAATFFNTGIEVMRDITEAKEDVSEEHDENPPSS